MSPIIVWFRQDLRLQDHPALYHACQKEVPVIPIYIYDDVNPGKWLPGASSRWWLHHSLQSLKNELAKHHGTLYTFRGDPLKVLKKIVKDYKPQSLYWNRCYEPYAIERDKRIKTWASDEGLEARSFNGSLLVEPWEVETNSGDPYRVFTPFWKAAQKEIQIDKILPVPKLTNFNKDIPYAETLESWKLVEANRDFSGFSIWTPGEEGAHQNLKRFLYYALENYAEDRDVPGDEGTSKLSPHLHFGEISPNEVYLAIDRQHDRRNKDQAKSCERYQAELGWREFSYHLLYHFPNIPESAFNPKFSDFPWHEDKPNHEKWQKGLTGYPIVDAGMRELFHTGWMHNRVRMLVASFLTKDLFIHWKEGEKWFWEHLVDADLANNSASWQWVAGSGADAAPYFRVFNPTLQGQKFDPEGKYVRKWVPEIASLPKQYIHKPWEAPHELLEELGIDLENNYALPIVDHSEQREQALKYFEKIKS
ncbi:MAG: deoxyribodipyrimidine photo-lyase [Chlamydiales bacterium]